MRAKFLREVAALGLPAGPANDRPVTEAELDPLPATAQRYLRYMGVVGRPRDWSFRLSFSGRFRLRLSGPWAPFVSWQYNTRLELARIFHMRLRAWRVVPLLGRDTYVRGHGRMLGKVLDLVTVVDAAGPEFDVGELITYLNDAILFAPSMLLGPETAWSEVDEHSFDVSLADHGTTVTARVFVDGFGAPFDFSTTDRFMWTGDGPPQRTRWTTPVEFGSVNGRPVTLHGQAVWHLPEGPRSYGDFNLRPGCLAFNVAPGT